MGTVIMDQNNPQYRRRNDPHNRYIEHGGTPSTYRNERVFETAPPRQQLAKSKTPAKKEQLHRFVGVGVGLASVISEHVLSHPCVVLRNQCQVNVESQWYHLTPFTLFQPIFNIHRNQSVTTLWKGIGSTLMVKGITVATETAICEVSPLPREVNRHSSLKKVAGHLVMKGIGILVTTPFAAASLVETVQSEIASESPGVLDCIKEGLARLMNLTTQQSTRLLPVWKLVIPTLMYGMCHYVISSLAKYTVTVSLRSEILETRGHYTDTTTAPDEDKSIMASYYPELVATFTGNLLADTVLFPLETVLHRLCLQGTRTIIDNTDAGLGVVPIITRYEGTTDCMRSILTEEGIGGLYKGFGALILQYGLHVVILKVSKVIFEQMSQPKEKDSPYLDPRLAAIMATREEQLRNQAPHITQSYTDVGAARNPRMYESDL